MGIQVREKTIEEIELRLSGMNTVLNKINYLESAIKLAGFNSGAKETPVDEELTMLALCGILTAFIPKANVILTNNMTFKIFLIFYLLKLKSSSSD